MSITSREIETQPAMWRQAAELAASSEESLPRPGQRVAAIGCGTSLYIASAYASLRETAGQGPTRAYPASEVPAQPDCDVLIAISRSGTTTEVLDALAARPKGMRAIALCGSADSPVARAADESIELPFADEESVVQTRFATSTLALLRASLGEDLGTVCEQAEAAIGAELPELGDAERIVFLGRGWAGHLADEAALKMREASSQWSESYAALEYRHGPISVLAKTLVWGLTDLPDHLTEAVKQTGSILRLPAFEPLAELVVVQRFAVALAEARGLNPDRPAHLERAVILK
jgi:fructoselysine-6-P-deglycase FrlB-like protein